jgi:AmmeMemoRadiSam system protein B
MIKAHKVIRSALGAGRWFPANRTELAGSIQGYIEEAFVPEVAGPIVAAIAPHAGYLYSGQVAGYTYRAIQDSLPEHGAPETVVVLGFSHKGEGQGVALMDGTTFVTPLGESSMDTEAATLLIAADPRLRPDYRPHMGEHSLENQIPFIQTVLPGASLVMALIASRDSATLDALAKALNSLARKKKILVIASSDMLHDSSYEKVRKTDQATLRKVVAMDTTGVMHDWDYSQQVFCGIGPVVTAMKYAQLRGVEKGTLLRYRNSGDDFPESRGQWVVGYGAVAFSV